MGIKGLSNLKNEDRIDVTFQKPDKNVTFYYATDLEDAKTRFQWVYGYWPTDEQVVKTVPSEGPVENSH